jgi:hypothetical protein
MWADELTSPGLLAFPSFKACCKHGKIKILIYLYETLFPELLRKLYFGQNSRSAEFLKYIRQYNAALVFTSCELKNNDRLGRDARYRSVSMQRQSVHRTGFTVMHSTNNAKYK